MISKKGKV